MPPRLAVEVLAGETKWPIQGVAGQHGGGAER
jgi:hypothetical protein